MSESNHGGPDEYRVAARWLKWQEERKELYRRLQEMDAHEPAKYEQVPLGQGATIASLTAVAVAADAPTKDVLDLMAALKASLAATEKKP